MYETITNIVVLGSLGNQYLGTLANNGVGFAPGGIEWPAEIAAELAQLEADIADGTVSVGFPGGEG